MFIELHAGWTRDLSQCGAPARLSDDAVEDESEHHPATTLAPQGRSIDCQINYSRVRVIQYSPSSWRPTAIPAEVGTPLQPFRRRDKQPRLTVISKMNYEMLMMLFN